jgi:hypothetical protein
MFGGLFLLSALVPPHPLEAFGPPGPTTPEVKPDWYLMWVYGFLKIVPPQATVTLFGATIGPNFLGGVLFPALLFGILTLAPWIDRTNRRVFRRFEYLEPLRQSPVRLASGVATLVFIGTLFIAAYYDTLGLSLTQIWTIVLVVPLLAGIATWVVARRNAPRERFDPRESPVRVGHEEAEAVPVVTETVPSEPELEPVLQDVVAMTHSASTPEIAKVSADDEDGLAPTRFPTIAARGDRARDSLIVALHELGELASLVRQLDAEEDLLEVLAYIDSLRLTLAESNQVLQGVVRGAIAEEPIATAGDLPRPERS